MRTLAVLLWIMAAPALAWAQTTARPQVLVLGTYHMANPGRDVHNMEADDVLSATRQREMTQLMEVLRRFRPTKIAVEAQVGSKPTAQRYAEYLAGTYTLSRNETDQIAFRLAKQLGHQTVYAVDESGDFPFTRVRNYAIANGARASFDSIQASVGTAVKAQGEFLRTHTLLETLEYMNSDSMVAKAMGWEYALVPFSDPYEYAGPDLVAAWFQRNIRIHRNIRALATSPGERILVVYGAGHLGWLRQNVANDPSIQLSKLADLTARIREQ